MDGDRDFRFSPRPNRAGEIKWRPWGEPAFAEARRLGRPVLLSLSAVWCHWCHVMDETSYSDPRVIAAVNEHFVPIRVDNDRHPDVNRRYNMGGWPTTAFLAPSGDVLTGATYLPPEQMLESLARVKAFFDANQAKITALEGECATDGDGSTRAQLAGLPLSAEGALDALEGDPDVPGDISTEVAVQVVRAFDPMSGGLGAEPKFPQPDVYGFMLAYGLLRGAGDPDHVPEGGSALLRPARVHEVVRATLTAMASGGLYDAVEGGFFRYATQRDWSVPHYEKMLEDNARLIRLYAEASLNAADHDLGDPDLYRRTAAGAVDYLLATLWREEASAFGGSQDADEHYYGLDADGRAKLAAALRRPDGVRGLERAGGASAPQGEHRTGPPGAHGPRRAPAGSVVEGRAPWRCRGALRPRRRPRRRRRAASGRPDGRRGRGTGRLRGHGRPALAAPRTGPRAMDLRAASKLPDGRLLDRLAVPGESAGLLAHPVPSLDENAAMAEVLLRLEAYTGEARLRERALETPRRLGAALGAVRRRRLLLRPGAAAVPGAARPDRDRRPPGRPRGAAAARGRPRAPRRRCAPSSGSTPPSSADAERLREAGLPAEPEAAARGFVCRGRSCSLFVP